MALTEEQTKRLDKLNFGLGGGFSDFMTNRPKLNPAGSKFLFVGLGGKGCDTIAGLKTDVYKRFKYPKNRTHPNNFEFLAVDADVEHLDNLCRGGFGEIGLSANPADSEICQLYDAQAAERLKPGNRKQIPSYITSWMNPTMNKELQGKGAGGIRQAGRYLLFGEAAFNILKNMLVHKLGKLQAQIQNFTTEELIVYIFAGVSGGTGSGTIIDVPYIIREICRANKWAVKIYGYVFLPDTYEREGKHLKYNAYAALKEIDTLMNIGQMDGAARFRAKYNSGFSVEMRERIFDTCVLISGKQQTGQVKKPERFTRRVVIDNIVNLVAANTRAANGTFLANSFLDNSPTEIQNKVNGLATPKNAHYQYTVIGAGAIILPLEQILCYIAHGSLKLLEEGWNKYAQQADVENLLQWIGISPDQQANAICSMSKVSMRNYTKGIGGPAKKEDVLDNSLYLNLQQMWLQYNTNLYNAWNVAKNKYLSDIIKRLNEYYQRMFQDEDGGIYFLKELLESRVIDGRSFNGVLYRLKTEYKDSIQDLINGEQLVINAAEDEIKNIQNILESPFCVGPLAKGKIEEYREQCINKFNAENRIGLYNTVVTDCLNQIIQWLETKLDNIRSYIDVFTYMKKIIDDNYRMVMSDTMPMADYAGKVLEFSKKGNDPATDQAIAYLDAMLAGKTSAGLTTNLESCLLGNEQKWILKGDGFNPMEVFVAFLEAQYPALPNLTLDKFLNVQYGANGVAAGMAAICTSLQSRAAVTFPVSANLSLTSLPSHRYVTVPAGVANIAGPVGAAAKREGADEVNSVDRNSIYWYNLVIGVPLWALLDIGEYEEAYEKNTVSGMHIQETAEDNWRDLPTLSNQDNWPYADFNPRERKYAKQEEEDVKDYLACGLVRKDASGLYQALCLPENNSVHTGETVIAWCRDAYLQNPLKDAAGNMECGSAFVDELAKENAFETYQVIIPTVYMNVDNTNVHKMIRMNIFLYRRLQETYRLYEKCRELLLAADRERQEAIRTRKQMKRFYDYVRTNIVQIGEDGVLLEKPDGDQEEILYFEDCETETVIPVYIYYAFERFDEIYQEEELSELDEHCKALLENHSQDSRSVYRAASERFMEICADQENRLKKLDFKRACREVGKETEISKAAEFYKKMLALRLGKQN